MKEKAEKQQVKFVQPHLHPSDARAVGRCAGGSYWLVFLAVQQLRKKMA